MMTRTRCAGMLAPARIRLRFWTMRSRGCKMGPSTRAVSIFVIP